MVFEPISNVIYNGSQLKNPDISGAIFTEFSMCRGRQICQGSLFDPNYLLTALRSSATFIG